MRESTRGIDFSRVRIHDDSRADKSARAVNALAYTVGSDIVFRAGWYRPESAKGREVLAHELVHVQQQRGVAAGGRLLVAAAHSSLEREAEADALASSKVHATVANRAPRSVQRITGVEEVSAMAVIAWCVSGALVTVAVDEVLQFGSSLFKSGPFRQNWCKTLFSALMGCVFGIVGGAIEKMLFEDGVARTGPAIAAWLIKKLKVFGYTQLSGKLGLALAKAGCVEADKTSMAETVLGEEDLEGKRPGKASGAAPASA